MREVRVTVEVVDGFTMNGKELVHSKEEILLGYLSEGLESCAEVEQVLDALAEAYAAEQE